MIRELTAGTVLLGLAACASSPPDVAEAPAAVAAPVSHSAAAPPDESATAPHAGSAEAPVAGAATADTASGDEDGLHVVEVPTVASTSPQPASSDDPHPDELICKRIKVTGSHRLQRVCRTRAEILRAREEAQAMHRSVTSTPDGIRAVDSTSRTMTRPTVDSR